jgi:hypothetical protein
MKAIFAFLLSAVLAGGTEIIPEFKTTKRVYTNVTIKSVEPDGIRIAHEFGAAKIEFKDLSPDQRQKFGLSEEKLNEYLKNQQSLRAAQRAATPTPARSPTRPTPTEEPPVYITPQQVKIYWLSQIPTPSTMDREYYSAKKARETYIIEVRAGKHDLAAEKVAASFNKNEAVRVRDFDRANLCETEIARISDQQLKIEQQRLENERSTAIAMYMQQIDDKIRSLNSEVGFLQMKTSQLQSQIGW